MTNVTLTCDAAAPLLPLAVTARISNGIQLLAALQAASTQQLPASVTLLDHVTLAGEARSSWPPVGVSLPLGLTMEGALGRSPAAPDTVFDMAGLPSFVKLGPGSVVRWNGLQVQVGCMQQAFCMRACRAQNVDISPPVERHG
jgi:hypothetical protein